MISALIAFALILTPIVVGLIGARFCAINTLRERYDRELAENEHHRAMNALGAQAPFTPPAPATRPERSIRPYRVGGAR